MKNIKSPVWLTSIGIILVLVAVILIGWFLLQGKTTVTGDWNKNETIEAISCEASNAKYVPLSLDNTTNTNTKVNATFSGEELMSLSFVYKAYHNSNEQAVASKHAAHATMDINFGKDHLGANAFDARYSVQDTIMQMNLYATAKDLKPITLKYFSINEIETNIYTNDFIKETYENQGFICKTIN